MLIAIIFFGLFIAIVFTLGLLPNHKSPQQKQRVSNMPPADMYREMLLIAKGMWIKGKTVLEISTFLVQYLAVSTNMSEERAVKTVADFMERFVAIARTHDVVPKALTDQKLS